MAELSARTAKSTNWHVLEGASRIVVLFKPTQGDTSSTQAALSASVIHVDETADLALLQIHEPPESLPTLAFGDPGMPGQRVHAIGHRHSKQQTSWTYRLGSLLKIRQQGEWTGPREHTHTGLLLELLMDTPSTPGSSGGVLLNDQSRLIGLTVWQQGEDVYAVGVGAIKDFLAQAAAPPSSSAPAGHE